MEGTIAEDQESTIRQKLEILFAPTGRTSLCPVRDILDRVGDKWSILAILFLGRHGTLRFNELKRNIDGVSQRMLTVTLRSLERDGLLTRRVYPKCRPGGVRTDGPGPQPAGAGTGTGRLGQRTDGSHCGGPFPLRRAKRLSQRRRQYQPTKLPQITTLNRMGSRMPGAENPLKKGLPVKGATTSQSHSVGTKPKAAPLATVGRFTNAA
jgi:DNA-binding HxlR family transcriptional regulator